MKALKSIGFGWVMVCLAWVLAVPATASDSETAARKPRTVQHAQAPSGVWFVPNAGQWHEDARFSARIAGGDWWLTASGWKVEMLAAGYDALGRHETPTAPLSTYVIDVRWEDAEPGVGFDGSAFPARHHVSYYLGDDPARWASQVRPTGKVIAQNVWPGIDAVMDGQRGDASHIKCDWHLAPGADPSAISLLYDGCETVLQADGTLKHFIGPQVGEGLSASGVWGHLLEAKPFAYQLNGTRIEEVSCAYALDHLPDGRTRIRFDLGEYDPQRALVIDPEIEFGSFVGATADSWGFTAAYDDEGRLIGGSGTRGAGYPTTAGAISNAFSGGDFDFGISVFSADGSTLEYSTYLGGSLREYPHSLVTDDSGDIYVMGTTGSQNFPTTADAYEPDFIGGPFLDLGANGFYGTYDNGCDIVVSKIDGVDGSLEASTFVGGTENDGLNLGQKLNYNYGDVCRGEVVIDPAGDVWVASSSRSDDFPMVDALDPGLSGPCDAVVFRLSNDLADLEFSTYFGGNSDDAAFAIQFSSAEALAYVTGGTKSDDLPTTPGAYQPDWAGDVDGFLFSIDYSGNPFLSTATYFGTDDYDQSYFVQLDTDNRPHLCGQTVGSDLALVGDVYDANPNGSTFVVRFTPNLETAEFVTRVGLPMTGVDISPTAFLVSDCNEMYISGWGGQTNSANSPYASQSTTSGMPTTSDAFQIGTDGSDFWLGVLAPDAADLTYGTYFGGQFSNEHVDGGTSRFDKNGTVYQAVCAGCGGWDDFPTTTGAWSTTNNSTNCNLGVFKFNLGSLVADIEIDAPDLICAGDPIQFINNSIGGTNYEWSFGDLSSSGEENPEYIYATPGEWDIMLIVSDVSGSTGCLEPDTAFASLFIEEIPQPLIDEIPPICEGESVNLQAYGTDALQWQPHPTMDDPTVPNPLVTPTQTTTYTVEDSNECGVGTADVTVVIEVLQTESSPDMTICNGDVVEIEATGGTEVLWSPTTGLGSPTSETTTASPTETTTYTALVSTPAGCLGEEEVTINVIQSAPGGQTYETIYLCTGQGVFLEAAPGESFLWSPADMVTNPLSQNPYTSPSQNTTYYVSIANACGVGTDSVSVELVAPTASATGGGWMCRGETMELSASDAVSYSWSPAALVANPNAQSTQVFPVETTTFTIYATDQFGCTGSTDITVYVWQPPYVDAGPDREVDWLDEVRLFGTVDSDTLWWSPSENLSCSDCLTPEVFVIGPQWFVLETVSPEGCIARDSTFIDVFYPVYIPNAFTPDNDGVNDAFFVQGVEARGYRLEIFNRWGDLLFYSEDPAEPWIGNHQLKDSDYFVPNGVYPWRLRYELRDGPRLLEGTVTLVR
jgi:gliding motility-associated-like protein